ncbi:hydrolase 76 protein [Irineochytrium annulatum]|nr:hydrolase 76 protein [Irineochytrium annulatum]
MKTTLILATVAAVASRVDAAIDLTSKSAVSAAISAGMKYMNMYYTEEGTNGWWNQNYLQWHESAIYFNTYLNHRKYLGDKTYEPFINSNLNNATLGPDIADFLDGDSSIQASLGKWNDDIGWWALAAVTGAEIWGPTANIDPTNAANPGAGWLKVAANTHREIFENWDTTTCAGGLWWSRDRTNQKNAYVKSAITHAETIQLGARLFAITKNHTYLDMSAQLYTWMKSVLIQPDYKIFDNANKPECQINAVMGTMIGSLILMANYTGDAMYMTEAINHFQAFQRDFVDPAKNVIQEPSCLNALTSCKTPNGYNWANVRGLTLFANMVNNDTLQQQAVALLQSQAQEMITTCDQTTWNCINTLTPYEDDGNSHYYFENGTNPRMQIEAMEGLLAVYATFRDVVPFTSPQAGGVPVATNAPAPTTKNAGERVAGIASTLTALVALVAMAAML